MKKALNTIQKLHMIQPGDKILVGLSGGPDSVALLHMLSEMRETAEIAVYAVHVNHMLRPEAEEETRHVEQLTTALQIPLKVFYEDVAAYAKQRGLSFEQAGHIMRFRCFREAAEEWQCNKLALGHHKKDVAESMLMHMIQGCGLQGLSAMPAIDGWIVRPLVEYQKEELIGYCIENGLSFDTDSTNFEPECLRNKIRLEILPRLEQYNPNVLDAFMRLQETVTADDDYLDRQAEDIWNQHKAEATFPSNVFSQQHVAMQRRLLRKMWKQATNQEADLSFSQIEQMRSLTDHSDGSQRISLAHGMEFYREYDVLGIRPVFVKSEIYEYEWNGQETLYLPECNGKLEMLTTITENRIEEEEDVIHSGNVYFAILDEEKLEFPLTVRNRREGDSIWLPNLSGKKKLKKFFIDKKIPVTLRNKLPLVLSGNEIIWIPGLYLSERIKSTVKTEKKLEIKCFLK